MSEVIALAGWPPEALAYAMAMYSRSSLSIRESILKITNEKAAGFFDKTYFGYGHKSIADNAQVPLGVEEISEIGAFELEDEQLWNGQERSTRYQKNFKKYFIPDVIRNTSLERPYCVTADFCLDQYERYSTVCFEALVKKYPKPQDMDDGLYERTIRARAFDVARYWLFNGIITSVGQITSARTLEEQICRMMASEYLEVVNIANNMKAACQAKPFCPEGKDEPPVAPTLVKYTSPNGYIVRVREYMRKIVADLEKKVDLHHVYNRRYAKLENFFMDIRQEIVAGLIYEATDWDYNLIHRLVGISTFGNLDFKWVDKVIGDVLAMREKHDALPRAFAAGYNIQFDICMDIGGRRDLHRHRNCIQLHQRFTVDRGFDVPDLVKEIGMYDHYTENMTAVAKMIRGFKVFNCGDYLIPFAFRAGTLYKMDYRQAEYMTVLRSAPQGHFSYRQIVCEMDYQLRKLVPGLEQFSRVIPFTYEDPFKR